MFSSLPGGTYPARPFPAADKAVHVALFAVLGALLARGARRGSGARAGTALAVGALGGALYGLTDELHQLFVPGRSPEWQDLVADAVGALAGAALAVMSRRDRGAGPNPAR